MHPLTPSFKLSFYMASVAILLGLAGCARPSGSSINATATMAPERIPPSRSTMAHTTDDEHDLPETKMFSNKEQIELKRITRHSPTATLSPDRPSTLEPIDVHFIEHGDRQLPFVALTFDLCQMPSNPSGFDREIVDVLMQTQTPATFFLGGDWMRTHVEETRQLAEIQYFELGNHSWSHPDFRELEEVEMSREIMRTQSTLFELTGRTSRLFRFPAGTYNALALSVVAWHGLRSIQWDVVSADPVPDNTAEMINERVRERVRSGSIIIMHANGRGWHTAEALPDMIKFLRGQGYCLVTVSQLLGIDPLPGSCGNDQPPARSGHVLPADQWNE